MQALLNPLSLTRKLVSYNSINPPGNERNIAEYCAGLLDKFGFRTNLYEFNERRTTVVARLDSSGSKLPICFTGHLDTIPLGSAPWHFDPFAGEVEGDRLYGRGTSDMKAGVAAMLCMAQFMATKPQLKAGLTLVLTAGEETACEGAHYVANLDGALGEAGAIIVGEPTSNYPVIGHKGCIRLELTTRGITAHAAMPELGDNAIYKAARAVTQLQNFDFNMIPHPLLGSPTLNVGTISGGMNVNSVPDKVTIGVDIRTIPGKTHKEIQSMISMLVGQEVEVTLKQEAISIATSPEDAWVQDVFDILGRFLGERPVSRAVSYFTDASALTPAFDNPPTIILGPGEAEQAHKTDEFCLISKIEQASRAYCEIAEKWCMSQE